MIREIIALIAGITIMGFAMHQFVKAQNVKTGLTLALLSVFAGLVIVNYDAIQRVKIGEFELETIKAEIIETKNAAIEEIEEEAQVAEAEINELNESAKNLTLDYVKLVQLQNSKEADLSSREMELINEKIEDESIKILEIVIPDEKERQEWIKGTQLVLPQ